MYPHDIPARPAGPVLLRAVQGRRLRHRLPPRRPARRAGRDGARAARPCAGPRHLDFHPTKPLVYVLNELDSTITTYRQERSNGRLTPLQVVRATPADFTGYSTTAEIAVDRKGRNLYISNRGHDSIGVFGIDPTTGVLTPRQWVPTKGDVPRFFALSPDQRFLYVANQGGNTIVTYRVERDGRLSPSPVRVKVGSPACIVFA
jgi:6-phosphogluconolactonase (cycloisomerase 2 family)